VTTDPGNIDQDDTFQNVLEFTNEKMNSKKHSTYENTGLYFNEKKRSRLSPNPFNIAIMSVSIGGGSSCIPLLILRKAYRSLAVVASLKRVLPECSTGET